MNPFVLLAFSIIFEVFGSSMLKLSNGFKKLLPSIGVVIGMGSAFYLLSITLQSIPLGTAYAIWAGAGTALTAVIGFVIWKEQINKQKILALSMIIVGVIIMKVASDLS